ncbi:MAG: lysylphosphatidylglycerol synthase transmembrane domain-containing protein [Methylococcaceae bacterium]
MKVPKIRARILLFFKGTLSVVLITLVFRQIDFSLIYGTLVDVPVWAFVLGLLACLAQGLALAWRWHRVVHWLGGSIGIVPAIRLTFIGLFFNQALPGSIGGDALRIWGAYRKGMASGLAVSSVAIERSTGLASLALLVTLALSQIWWNMEQSEVRWLLLAAAPSAALGLCLLSVSDYLPLTLLPSAIAHHVSIFANGLRRILGNLVACTEVISLGALSSVLAISQAYLVGSQIGIELGFAAYICVLGGAVILTVIPISLAGWGLREAAVVGLFGEMGVPSDKSLVVSLLFGLALTLSSLPGGVIWLVDGKVTRTSAPPAA